MATGWSRSIQYFLEQNYTTAELYVTTWGDTWGTGNILDNYNTMHTCSYLLYLRRFVEAVISYTEARKVDVIAHSIGVPLARCVLFNTAITIFISIEGLLLFNTFSSLRDWPSNRLFFLF